MSAGSFYSTSNEQIFRRIFESANEGIWILDDSARIVLVNPRLLEMLGYGENEILGRFKWEFVAPADRDEAIAQFERRRRGVSEKFELRLRHKSGHEIWTVFAARSLFENGQFRGALDMISDNTAVKEAQLKVAEAQRELENRVAERTIELQETVFQLESFSYSIAHDMRAPLRAISGYGHVLQDEHGPNLNPEGRELIQRMIDAALRLDTLILDVLNYSRIIRGEMDLDQIDLAKLLDDVRREYPQFKKHQHSISADCGNRWVCGNKAALTQVIANLLDNALKFVPAGVTPRVRIWCEDHGENVRLCFEDNGIGIEAEHLRQIWGVFHRLHNAEYPGTGIGLAIVKRAVDRMGGAVGVRSEPGHGSCFWVELPRSRPAGSPCGESTSVHRSVP